MNSDNATNGRKDSGRQNNQPGERINQNGNPGSQNESINHKKALYVSDVKTQMDSLKGGESMKLDSINPKGNTMNKHLGKSSVNPIVEQNSSQEVSPTRKQMPMSPHNGLNLSKAADDDKMDKEDNSSVKTGSETSMDYPTQKCKFS